MTKHFFGIVLVAIVSVSGMAIGASASGEESDATSTTASTTTAARATEKLPTPATEGDLHLERAARDFRIRTYQTFRANRAEYDRRQAEAAKLQRAWEAAGSDLDDQPKLIEWFEQATARAQVATDSPAELPPLPTFASKLPKQNDESAVAETSGKKPSDQTGTMRVGHWQLKPTAASSTVPTAKSQAAKSAIEAVKATILGSPEQKANDPNGAANAEIPGTLGADLNQALDMLSKKLSPAPQGKDR